MPVVALERQLARRLSHSAVRVMQQPDSSTDVVALVEFNPTVDFGGFRQAIEGLGGVINSVIENANTLVIAIPASRLQSIATLDGVIRIEADSHFFR